LSFILLKFTVKILKFLFAGRLNTLLLFDLFLLVFIFDVVVYKLFVFGLLALSGLNALEVTDSKVLKNCVLEGRSSLMYLIHNYEM